MSATLMAERGLCPVLADPPELAAHMPRETGKPQTNSKFVNSIGAWK